MYTIRKHKIYHAFCLASTCIVTNPAALSFDNAVAPENCWLHPANLALDGGPAILDLTSQSFMYLPINLYIYIYKYIYIYYSCIWNIRKVPQVQMGCTMVY
jgi:hypothetical protein